MTIDPGAGYTAAQVRAAEQPLLAAGEPLMDRAAAGLAAATRTVLAATGRPRGSVLVLAGSGSNGGDALLASAALARRGHPVVVARLGRRIHARGLRTVLQAGGVVLAPDAGAGRVAAAAEKADVLLDGLLGTGASGRMRPPARQAVARILEVAAGRTPVVAVDLPSGLGADDGVVRGPLLRAAATVTFGAMKAGLLLAPPSVVGRLVLVDIGLAAGLRDVRPAVRARADQRCTVTVSGAAQQ